MDRLVPAHHAVDAGPVDADRHPSESAQPIPPKKRLADLIPLTVSEIRTLLVALFLRRTMIPTAVLAFSQWRRHHQLTAKRCHYKARGSPPLEVEL